MSATSGMDNNAVIRGLELRLDTLISGLLSALPAGVTQLKVGDVMYQIPDLIKKAQEFNQPNKSKRAAHSVIRQAKLTEKRDREVSLDFLADMKAALVAELGRENATLTSFGFTPQGRRHKKAKAQAEEPKPSDNQGQGKTA